MKTRLLITVPTFDNPGTIGTVVRDLLAAGDLNVLVVDDGSRVPVRTVLAAADLTEGQRLSVLRLPRNQGKGVALEAAFEWALGRGYTHVLSFDGDGQHLPSSVPALALAAAEHPWSVVIGARRFPAAADGGHVPGASRFGRAFSNFWIRYETGMPVDDSQSGLRVYPLFFVQGLKCRSRRFAFEVEALTRLLWAGASLTEVPVDVHYPPKAERVSHFKKGRDNVRISLLNAWLVTVSLFQRHRDARKLQLATLVAACVAALPLLPAATFAALVVAAVALQLNGWVLLAWFVGSLMLPDAVHAFLPLAGLLVAFAIALSRRREGDPATPDVTRSAADRVTSGVAGSPWTGKTRGGRFGNYFLYLVSRTLGLAATYVCLAFIAPYFYLFAPRARRSSLEYFGAVFPEAPGLTRRWHVLVNFYTFGMVLLDKLYQSVRSEPQFDVTVLGKAAFDRAAQGGKGVIVLTAHAGGWDLSARSLAQVELGKGSVIAEFVAGPPVAPSLAKDGTSRLSMHNDAAPVLAYKELLQDGKIVGMMGDRPLSDKLELVPFLGRLAAFDLTPFRIAMALRVEVVYCFAFKTGLYSYELALESAPGLANVAPAERAARGVESLTHYAASLERHIRRHPHQWFNFYPFFSTRPVPHGA